MKAVMTEDDQPDVVMPAPAATKEEWYHVEIMGHRQHWGLVHEEVRFGVPMLVIEVPTEAPGVFTLHSYPGAAIFGAHSCEEDYARARALGFYSVDGMKEAARRRELPVLAGDVPPARPGCQATHDGCDYPDCPCLTYPAPAGTDLFGQPLTAAATEPPDLLHDVY
jgi:hypothetical protein